MAWIFNAPPSIVATNTMLVENAERQRIDASLSQTYLQH